MLFQIVKAALMTLALTGGAVQAQLLSFTKTSEPPLTDAAKAQIEAMNINELRAVQTHYRELLESTFGYLRLVTGSRPQDPSLVRALLKRQYISNIYALKHKAAEVIPQFNQAIELALEKRQPVQLFLHDIKLTGNGEECSVNPILETVSMAELHGLIFTCNEQDLQKLEPEYLQVIAYSSDYFIRAKNGGKVIPVNPLLSDTQTRPFTLSDSKTEIVVTGKISIKPVKNGF